MADLRIAHIGIIRQAHGGPVRLDFRIDGGMLAQPVEIRCLRDLHEVALRIGADTDSVHDDQHNRAFRTAEYFAFPQ
jgi:hypothetical protein